MDYKKYTLVIALFFCVSLIPVFANNVINNTDTNNTDTKLGTVIFEPSLTLPNDVNQMIELKCSLTLNESIANNETIEFAIGYENVYKVYEPPEFRNDSYFYKIFNHTYSEWKSMFYINEDWFVLTCKASADFDDIDYSPATIQFSAGTSSFQIHITSILIKV